MTKNEFTELLLNAATILRTLADVTERIAYGYRELTAVTPQTKVVEAKEVKELPLVKKVSIEEVRAVLSRKSQENMTAEVRELIHKYGATKLTEVDPENYAALMADAEALGNG